MTTERPGKTVLDRKDLRSRKCWWISLCCVRLRGVCVDCKEEFAYWSSEEWGHLCGRCLGRRVDTKEGYKQDRAGFRVPLDEDDIPIPLRQSYTPTKISTEKVLKSGLISYIVEVSIEEARNGSGRVCPECGRTSGSYVCDGLPTYSATTILTRDEREAGEGTSRGDT